MDEGADEQVATDGVEQYVIGLSFGNSNSSIATLSPDGKAEVIANEEGDRLIPSVLSYFDGEEFHGTQAKSQLVRNSGNTIAYFRDFLGKESIDPSLCHASVRPTDDNSQIVFTVQDTDGDQPSSVSVSEVTTRHIRRLKQSASDFSGKEVTAAVISIPTDASEAQRLALTRATEAAHLQILQMISEPIAALLAYEARGDAGNKIVVVADLGGTRSDIAVVASRGGMYSVLGTVHDHQLGGTQLDQVLVDHFAKEFIKQHKTDPRQNSRSLAKLKLEAESVKKTMSLSGSATFSVESLADGLDFRSTINRVRYETLAARVFKCFSALIEAAIKKAELDVMDIDEVILAGGTSHTPKIARNTRTIFPGSTKVVAPSTQSSAINPAYLSATGAAIQASLIHDFEKDDIDQSTHPMVTVTPHILSPIGIQIEGNDNNSSFEMIIPQDSAVPVRHTKVFRSAAEGDIIIRVCEGKSHIKVTKPEPKSKALTNGTTSSDAASDSEFGDDGDEEEEDIREKVLEATNSLAEMAMKVVKGGKIEVSVNIGADMSVSLTARDLGSRAGTRGQVEKPKVVGNGQI